MAMASQNLPLLCLHRRGGRRTQSSLIPRELILLDHFTTLMTLFNLNCIFTPNPLKVRALISGFEEDTNISTHDRKEIKGVTRKDILKEIEFKSSENW